MPEPTFWIALASLGFLMVLAIVQGRIKDQLGRLERKVDRLLKSAGGDVAALTNEEIAALIREGKKIEAIKAYRELTGAGLAEAKNYIESLMPTP